ncbi:hypothetical protein C8J57DRAFT_1534968 [Mycena rebaudengoi]|nr:hypothetical protein C8J57DRAFT_1534968 [Mycena rebaudengoi]
MYKPNSSSPEDVHRLAHEALRVGFPHLTTTLPTIAAITARTMTTTTVCTAHRRGAAYNELDEGAYEIKEGVYDEAALHLYGALAPTLLPTTFLGGGIFIDGQLQSSSLF